MKQIPEFERLAIRYQNGVTLKDLAHEAGVDSRTLRRHLVKAGIEIRRHSGQWVDPRQIDIEEAIHAAG